jgi:ribosomal protein L14E/L6E/L27E
MINNSSYQIGDIVKSKQGHDTGRVYAVVKVDGEFAFVRDGVYRTIESPKKKRMKHLQFMGKQELLPEINDVDLKKILEKWRNYVEG